METSYRGCPPLIGLLTTNKQKRRKTKKAKKPGKSEYLRKNRKGNVLKSETLTERRDNSYPTMYTWTLPVPLYKGTLHD